MAWAAQKTDPLPRERALYLVNRRRLELAGPDPIAEEAARLQTDYRAFLRAAWPVIDTDPLVDGWYIDALADHCQAWIEGQIPALMIHIRPRSGKTNIVSVALHGYKWTTSPTTRFLWASYSKERRNEDSRRARKLVGSEWYQARWPREIEDDQNEKHRFALKDGGNRFSAIYGSGATGDGGDFLGLDDPQCGADQDSPTELDSDHKWYYGTWQTRRNQGAATPELICAQRLGPDDLAGRLRYDDPHRWQVLALQTRRTLIAVVDYWKGEDRIMLPLIDTALSRDGRFEDPREPGELLSSRDDDGEVKAKERNQPSVSAAQDQQAPIKGTAGGARVHLFDRKAHMSQTFAARMNAEDLPSACAKALKTGWKITTGWDHGQDARREICVGMMWHEGLKEAWIVFVYANTTRTTPDQDARAVRAILDGLCIPFRVVQESSGDVGNLGKGTDSGTTAAETNARRINTALSMATYADGAPILGFTIGIPNKGPGSVRKGTEVLNVAFSGGSLRLDPSCAILGVAIEGWTGGEALKDFVDALRYCAVYRLNSWQTSDGIQT